MKKILTIITLLAVHMNGMAQNRPVYEWRDSVPLIRAVSDMDSITFYLPEDLVDLATGNPSQVKKTSMTSSLNLSSAFTFANDSVTEQGICYSPFNSQPTINDSRAKFGTFTKGSCEVTVAGLKNGTFYYYRPYLIVADMVYYGQVNTFSTWEGAGNQASDIFESLKDKGSYKTYLRLAEDPDVRYAGTETGSLSQALSKPGSKTVFAANDQAWDKFFDHNKSLPKDNPWHTATSYEKLSKNQKNLLLHASVVNHAISVEQLSDGIGENPAKGVVLRRHTNVEAMDSITRVAVSDLPVSYWSVDKQTSEEYAALPEADQWLKIRNGGEDSICMLMDNSPSMMIHLTKEYMNGGHITDEDFRIITGQQRTADDVHIYNIGIDEADILCENGYFNSMAQPLVPLANMAELIRTNGRTNIFAHLMDRFSVPFRNADSDANTMLYVKRYYSQRGYASTGDQNVSLIRDEDGNIFADAGISVLKYDPGWNGYFPLGKTEESDMGAMFVPNDKQMLDFFMHGGGATLIQEYAKDPAWDYDIDNLVKLYEDIDQIPLDRVSDIINHCMQESFAASVPSKMTSLRNVAYDQIFYPEDVEAIDTALLACNGVVYVMGRMQAPADYSSVAAPAYLRSTNKIMRWAVYADNYSSQNTLGLHYYAYLKAMENRFSFFMPSDEALGYYYDPVSFTSRYPRMLKFKYNPNSQFPFVTNVRDGICYRYDIATGQIGSSIVTSQLAQGEIIDRLRQILEGSTIAHTGWENTIDTDEDEYYLAKNGMGIKVTRENGRVVRAQGGFQLENEREGIASDNPGILYCNVDQKENSEFRNGYTFTIDAPLIPASRSVFSVLSNMPRGADGDFLDHVDQTAETNPFYEFFRLCRECNEDFILYSGLVDKSKYNLDIPSEVAEMQRILSMYRTFVSEKTVDWRVQFFHNFNYTVLVPSNEAIREAIDNGLPTWESIKEDFDSSSEYGVLKTAEDSLRIQAKIIYLTNFVRSHFVDKSYFADKSTMRETTVTTNSFNRETGMFVKYRVKREESGVLSVQDAYNVGSWRQTIPESHGLVTQNIMTCDRELSGEVKANMALGGSISNISLNASGYAVVHLIDGVLQHTDQKPSQLWGSKAKVENARLYVKRFAIQ